MNVTSARVLVRPVLARLQIGTLTVVEPDGTRMRFGSGSPHAELRMHSDRVWARFMHGSLGLAEAYAEGLWDSPDLVALVRLGARAMPALDRLRSLSGPLSRPMQLARAIARPYGREQRRRDVGAHYDLGNDLFSLMLDSTMTYSCALFSQPGMSLEEAQLAKLERVCTMLDLRRGDRVLEIGSGWGSFARHAAATRGCHVTTTTISAEQHHHVRTRVASEGLGELITVLDRDYRDLRGRYNKLVSIEMIEAVGWRGFAPFLRSCAQLLEPDGAMLLQAITIDDRAYQVEKASRSFIKEYIFPGGALPSVSVLARALGRRTDLRILDLEDLTEHYPETLRRWRARFEQNSAALARRGYDERFRRIWDLYLAYCEAGFVERRISDVQVLLGKPRFRAWAGNLGGSPGLGALERAL
ncbi:MAG: class I SAM-dependent methyltransferase [Solirubrobacteraceae bacterium]